MNLKATKLNKIIRNLTILGISTYIYFIFLNIKRISYRVAFEEFLWDYKFGICRRALEGQLFSIIHKTKFSDQYFINLSLSLNIIAFVIFISIAYKLLCKNINYTYLILVYITSPLTFKNQIYDIGRQDIIGFIFTELIFLLILLNKPKQAAIFFSLFIIPLCMIADNNVLFWGPTCISLILLSGDHKSFVSSKILNTKNISISFKPIYVVLALSFSASIFIPFLLRPPTIPEANYRDYLQTKAVYSIFYPGNTGYSTAAIYVKTGDSSLAKAHNHLIEINAYKNTLKNILDYIYFALPIILLYIVGLKYNNKGSKLLYTVYLLLVVLFYAPAFYITYDFPRYYSNITMCLYFLSFYYIYNTNYSLGETVKKLSVVYIVIQIIINQPFGISIEEGSIITNYCKWLCDGFKGNHFMILR